MRYFAFFWERACFGRRSVTGFSTLFIGLCVWFHNYNKRTDFPRSAGAE
jgi:hypothetical protein